MKSDSGDTDAESDDISGGLAGLVTHLVNKHQISDQERAALLRKLIPHIPGVVTFADHTKALPWSVTYLSVVMFADISGFTALCERYSENQKSGIDQLTKTLNDYLEAIVDGIFKSHGDVVKFAGDAIFSVWRVNSEEELAKMVDEVVKCCLDIQESCGDWETDVGVKLSVKMGISAGEMSISFIGNDEYRVYVEQGPSVNDVKVAESFCKSGYVVLSPDAWDRCDQSKYTQELMLDEQHVRITGYKSDKPNIAVPVYSVLATRRFSLSTQHHYPLFSKKDRRRSSVSSTGSAEFPAEVETKPTRKDSIANILIPEDDTVAEDLGAMTPKTIKKKGLAKLRSAVKTVKDMKLEEALRLYILRPVLGKLDDGQPLDFLSEMRQVSIVFMNLVLEEQTDVNTLLQKAFRIVFQQIRLVQGCLNKVFLFDKGCTFLIIFGLPGYKHEKDCQNALNCSFRMKALLEKIDDIVGVSIGVTTGVTFCGVVGHQKRHEYSVIGRKVNMAARLMMHYYGKVTCDEDTFVGSRLPGLNFKVLVTKRMKGLRNVGIIREYTEKEMISAAANDIPRFAYPILGREKEYDIFYKEITCLLSKRLSRERRHVLYTGATGIGKTRLLDHIVLRSAKEDVRIIGLAMDQEANQVPLLLVRHILRSLLTNAGFSNQIDREPALMDTLRENGQISNISLMSEIFQIEIKENESMNLEQKSEDEVRLQICRILAKYCLEKSGPTVLVIDEVDRADTFSWDFLLDLSKLSSVLIVASAKSVSADDPPNKSASLFIESERTIMHELGSVDPMNMSSLACQILEVSCIPSKVDRILRDFSQGVPSWCNDILRELYNKKLILIMKDNGTSSWKEGTISPKQQLLTKLEGADGYEGDGADHEYTYPENLTSECTEDHYSSTHNMLEGLGFLHTIGTSKSHVDGLTERICAASPDNIIPDGFVPDCMKELIISRLDSLRASDQLLVKCAAVLGVQFERKMLEYILPTVRIKKIHKSLNRLFNSEVFICGNTPPKRYSRLCDDIHHKEDAQKVQCYCPHDQPHKTDSLDLRETKLFTCRSVRFKIKLLQESAYQTLLENQQIELHEKAAKYCELNIKELKYQLRSRVLFVSPCNMGADDEKEKTDIPASPDTLIKAQVPETFDISNLYPIIDYVLESSPSDQTTTLNLDRLKVTYDQIIYHTKCAKNVHNLIEILTDASGIAIAQLKSSLAFEFATEALNLLDKTDSKDETKWKCNITRKVIEARLQRLIGEAYFLSGCLLDASRHLKCAAELFGLKQPRSKLRAKLKSFIYRNYTLRKIFDGLPQPENTGSDRLIGAEQGICLFRLFQLYQETGNKELTYFNAIRFALKSKVNGLLMHQVVNSFCGLLECLRQRKRHTDALQLEKILLMSCSNRYQELSWGDLNQIGNTMVDTCSFVLSRGELQKALCLGKVVAYIGKKTRNWKLSSRILPYLAITLLHKNDIEGCCEELHELRQAASELDNNVVWARYYSICIDLMLYAGFAFESIQNCLHFAATYLKTCDVFTCELLPRFNLAMSIALWYCRRGEWEYAQPWFDFWEIYEFIEASYHSVSCLLKKLECLLSSYYKAKEWNCDSGVVRMESLIKEESATLRPLCSKVPCALPRFQHLCAYFRMLQGSYKKAKEIILKAKTLAEKQDNKLQVELIDLDLTSWDAYVSLNDQTEPSWQSRTDKHIFDWNMDFQRSKPNLYSLPLPTL